MNLARFVVQGAVMPDGTLNLSEKVTLSPGKVRITIEPIPESTPSHSTGWWQNLQAARAALEARGTGFRSQEEIEAERQSFRSDNDLVEISPLP